MLNTYSRKKGLKEVEFVYTCAVGQLGQVLSTFLNGNIQYLSNSIVTSFLATRTFPSFNTAPVYIRYFTLRFAIMRLIHFRLSYQQICKKNPLHMCVQQSCARNNFISKTITFRQPTFLARWKSIKDEYHKTKYSCDIDVEQEPML